VQHGFTDMGSFTDPRFQIPSAGGPMVSLAIAEFLANPQEPKMYVDQVPWPYNIACNGQVTREAANEVTRETARQATSRHLTRA
jgi:hypothetical protein